MEAMVIVGLILALIAAFVLYKVLKTLKNMVVNTVVGLGILFVAKFFGLNIAINAITILICAIAGVIGALIVILLSYLGVTF
ncbi:MAG: pro-sigmaK processing inhibitor BofA family protein [Methanosarcinaceae archaeon]|nr:pro-sigmaK processing inhibitor BofA family protein [Methanosarcinaceae archaeon]